MKIDQDTFSCRLSTGRQLMLTGDDAEPMMPSEIAEVAIMFGAWRDRLMALLPALPIEVAPGEKGGDGVDRRCAYNAHVEGHALLPDGIYFEVVSVLPSGKGMMLVVPEAMTHGEVNECLGELPKMRRAIEKLSPEVAGFPDPGTVEETVARLAYRYAHMQVEMMDRFGRDVLAELNRFAPRKAHVTFPQFETICSWFWADANGDRGLYNRLAFSAASILMPMIGSKVITASHELQANIQGNMVPIFDEMSQMQPEHAKPSLKVIEGEGK